MAWALKVVAFTQERAGAALAEHVPDAEVLRLPDAGHYLQEDAHERIVLALIDHLRRW
jgi:pimeloyl-ACP methyl ester carboxylesterase